ncbi:MAG: ferritin family protein [Dehalococcoidia bacterium]|nr:MAG: ferritin family protein [Dehalococcoidia bacterium]UCG83142.1 MAG: ferritin family protein [Dehalococcoidia bacterium]
MIEDITLKGCIEFAVATEDNGIKFYNRLAQKFSDNKEVAEIFSRLAKDEEVHKAQFSRFLSDVPQEEGVTEAPEKHEYVKAMSISEFFSRSHGPFQNVDKIEDRDDALEKAFGFEKATLGFYQAVRDMLGENPTLLQVIEAEKEHVRVLMKTLITGAKFRSLQDRLQ